MRIGGGGSVDHLGGGRPGGGGHRVDPLAAGDVVSAEPVGFGCEPESHASILGRKGGGTGPITGCWGFDKADCPTLAQPEQSISEQITSAEVFSISVLLNAEGLPSGRLELLRLSREPVALVGALTP